MIKVIRGDITSQTTDVIVNAANTHLLAGSGVCGAIHRVAGPKLERKCREMGGCPTGEARITDAYYLPCKHVIHAVAPRYSDGTRGEPELLRRCYQSILLSPKNTGSRASRYQRLAQGFIVIRLKKRRRLLLIRPWLHRRNRSCWLSLSVLMKTQQPFRKKLIRGVEQTSTPSTS